MIITRVLASVEVTVEGPADTRLIMSLQRGVYTANHIPIRVFPYADEVSTRYGTLTEDGDRLLGHTETLTFSGTTARPKYPLPSNFTFDAQGTVVDRDLNLVTPAFAYDSYRDEVVPYVGGILGEVYGAVHVGYLAPYRRYIYQPQSGLEGGVFVTRISSIAGRLGTTIALLEINDDTIESGDYEVFYEVVSDVVVDASGQWEKPPNFPDDNTYPGLNITGPSTSSYVIDARKHEYGYVNRDGRTQIDRQYIRYYQPYTGSLTYKPDWRYEPNTSPPAGFESAFASISWGSIEASVQSRYPGISI